ncbi:MAG: hypothetical protein QOD98_2420 [Nocardioidaceae bacterium]|nr:hypothetical protein [Nocardioidaceae bacterium]
MRCVVVLPTYNEAATAETIAAGPGTTRKA